jgi:CRISPR-associated protein Csm3
VFGPHKFDPRKHQVRDHPGPSRLLVRDAQAFGPVSLEIKTESVNDRVTGQAGHPRPVERVAAGAQFRLRMTLQVFDTDSQFKHGSSTGKDALLAVVCKGLRSVEETGIGGGISRGSGEVKIEDLTVDGQPWQCS